MAKVRRFDTGIDPSASARAGQRSDPPSKTAEAVRNAVPDIPKEAVDSVAASAPVQIRGAARSGPGNPRKRRYRQKSYSLLQEDIDRIEALVVAVRSAGLYDRSRSDIVRAGVALLQSLPLEDQLKAVQSIENLRSS